MPAEEEVEELAEYPVDEFKESGDDDNGKRHRDSNDKTCKEFAPECNTYRIKHIYYLFSTVPVETVKRDGTNLSLFQAVFRYVEVRIDILNIIVVFEGIDQP